MKSYSFSEYQKDTALTAIYPCNGLIGVYYTTLGLTGEAGEIANKVKKIIREDDSVLIGDIESKMGFALTEEKREAIKNEIGDVLWYCSQLCSELGLDMEDVARSNIKKLAKRKFENKIKGEGDNR